MRTFMAILRDTLIALRRRRLFWLHVWLSLVVLLLYAGVSCHQTGWSIGYGLKSMESSWLKQGTPWENTLHCWMLARIMSWWVVGGSIFFALFSTAAVLPETLEPGSAALIVPRARRRSLILAGRFAGSVLYAMGHAALVVLGLWLIPGWRLNLWHHSLWLAVPLAGLLFAPLQAVAMLLGVLTRSATAAVLVAILFAGSVWALQAAAAGALPAAGTASVDLTGGNAREEGAAEGADAPDATRDSGEGDDRNQSNDSTTGSGLSDALADEASRYAAVLLPPSRAALFWLERRACPVPPQTYNDLFRRLRAGHSGLSAAAADVMAAASAKRNDDEGLFFTPLLFSSTGFSAAVFLLAAWLLKRRDL